MRRANTPRFRQLLAKFTSEVVEPVLDVLAQGRLSVAGGSPADVFLRLDTKKDAPIRSTLDMGFWTKNGAAVRAEYDAWRAWLARHPLCAPLLVSKLVRHAEVKKLFDGAFYGLGLNSEKVWTALGTSISSRRALCEAFIDEVGHSTCIYCDIDTVRGAYSLEHFVPRSRAMYLAVDPANLYVSCDSCNSTQRGKGVKLRLPIVLPGTDELGIRISFYVASGTIGIAPCTDSLDENWVLLLNLRSRYGSTVVARDAARKAARIIETAARVGKGANAARLRYHAKHYKEEPLYYATRYLLQRLPRE